MDPAISSRFSLVSSPLKIIKKGSILVSTTFIMVPTTSNQFIFSSWCREVSPISIMVSTPFYFLQTTSIF